MALGWCLLPNLSISISFVGVQVVTRKRRSLLLWPCGWELRLATSDPAFVVKEDDILSFLVLMITLHFNQYQMNAFYVVIRI